MAETLRLTPKAINEILDDLQKELEQSRGQLRRESLTRFAEEHGKLSYGQLKEMLYALSDAADRVSLVSVPKTRRARVKKLREAIESEKIDRRKASEVTNLFLSHNLTIDLLRFNEGFKEDPVVGRFQRAVANHITSLANKRMEFGVPRSKAYADAWRFMGQILRNIENMKGRVSQEVLQENLPLIWEAAKKRAEAARLYGEFALDYKKELDQMGVTRKVDWKEIGRKKTVKDFRVPPNLPLETMDPFLRIVKMQPTSRGEVSKDPNDVWKYLLSHRKTILRRYQPTKIRRNIPLNLKEALKEYSASLSPGERPTRGWLDKMSRWGKKLEKADSAYYESKRIEEHELPFKLQQVSKRKRRSKG